jgi:hypothetical protein
MTALSRTVPNGIVLQIKDVRHKRPERRPRRSIERYRSGVDQFAPAILDPCLRQLPGSKE